MDIVHTDADTATVRLTTQELIILNNAINEVKNALESWEFWTRMGVEKDDAEALRAKLSAVLDAVKRS